MEIWNIIVQSNTFNFIIFIAVFAVIFKAAKVGTLISNRQNQVKQSVDDSQNAKENSILELKSAEVDAQKVSKEIKEILDNADLQVMRLGRKILADANVASEGIILNADKINDATGKKLISDLTLNATLVSAEIAKRHIIATLKKKPQYHAKFIEDSINELDRLKF